MTYQKYIFLLSFTRVKLCMIRHHYMVGLPCIWWLPLYMVHHIQARPANGRSTRYYRPTTIWLAAFCNLSCNF